MSKLTLSAASKGAFRVTVTGAQPDAVHSIVLAGSGDEKEMDLPPGDYVAHVLNIGTGVSEDLVVALAEHQSKVLKVPSPDQPSTMAFWRSFSLDVGSGQIPQGMSPNPGWTSDKQFKLKAKNADGRWVRFLGKVLTNPVAPGVLKIQRPSKWDEAPILKFKFVGVEGAAYTFIPMFSGGTFVHALSGVHEILPCDEKAAAIVGGLSRSMKREASDIVEWASGCPSDSALKSLEKRKDPWLVAAAGLNLVSGNRPKARLAAAAELAHRHPWCTDLGVLDAWWSAVRRPNDASACLDNLVEARRNGKVYFWSTFFLADKLLVTLGSGRYPAAQRAAAVREMGNWKALRQTAFRVGTSVAWYERSSADDEGRSKVG